MMSQLQNNLHYIFRESAARALPACFMCQYSRIKQSSRSTLAPLDYIWGMGYICHLISELCETLLQVHFSFPLRWLFASWSLVRFSSLSETPCCMYYSVIIFVGMLLISLYYLLPQWWAFCDTQPIWILSAWKVCL